MSINYLEYDNLFALACDVNDQFYNVYDGLYDAANKVYSTNDGVVNPAAPPPHNLMPSLVASVYLYTDFYIDSITIDSVSDQKIDDQGGALSNVLENDPGTWVNVFEEMMKVANDPQQLNDVCRRFFIELATRTGGIGIFNHIVGCYFDGLARYDVNWQPDGRPVEVFSIAQKKAFATKCTGHLYNFMNATTEVPAAMPVQAPGITTGPTGMDMGGGNTAKLKKIKKIKKTKKKNKKLKNIKKSKKHNKTRKKKTHKKHNKRRNKKTHKKN